MIQAMNDSSDTLSSTGVDFPQGILDRPALLIVKLSSAIVGAAEDRLVAMGLSGRQYMVLAVLSSDAPPSQMELAGLCGLLPAQVVPVIDEMERRGLVTRQRSETDRRRSVVNLTEKGREALAQADALGEEIVSQLPREALEVAVRALSRSYNTA